MISASGYPGIASRNGSPRWHSGERAFPALRLAQSSRRVHLLAKFLLALLALSVFALLFVPWQQSVTGTGQVVAYAPLLRQQTVQSPISGRIVRWNEQIVEGARVEKGELILEIHDLDPELLPRLHEQLQATERKLAAARTKVEVYTAQVEAFTDAGRMAVAAADEQISMAMHKVRAEQKHLEAVRAALHQEQLDFARQDRLAAKGLASGLEQQISERKYKEAAAKVEQAEAYLDAARNELASKRAERVQKEREAQAKVESARAYLQNSEGEVATTEKELADIRVKVSRQQSQVVRAPQDGFILRLLAAPGADLVKAGDPLFVLVPDTADRAVELWVDGNDAPLVTPGRHVRLQFEGWPAVQFAGWPSVAVGTFGGEVVTVDATNSGNGEFRILIVPAEGEQWPADRYLRQGVRANGWVLLNQVTLGYELWRKMNGFPPAVEREPIDGTKLKKAKP